MQAEKQTCRQSYEGMTTNVQQARTQRCVQADMKTLMLTKSRPTTYMDEKNGPADR
jgi:hypothetical protein